MEPKFDLLGDPIPENHGKPGANGHVATAENINKVRLLVVAGMSNGDIASYLGITVPTLRKHYFRNATIKTARQRALAEAKGRNLLQISAEADKGNITALKEMRKIITNEEVKERGEDVKNRKPAAAPKPGKKEQQVERAVAAAGSGSGSGQFLPKYETRH